TRDHDALASMSAMTSSAGRVFYILDEGHTSLMHRPPKWKLIARDAFNGVLLWKRDIPTWVTHLFYFRSGPAQMPRRLVSVGDRVYATLGFDAPVSALDAATGKTVRTFEGSEKTEEIIHHRDTLLAVVGEPEIMNEEAPKVYGYWQLSVMRKPTVEKAVVAYEASTGKVLWRKTGKNLEHLAPLSLTACGDRAFFLDGESLHCVGLADGRDIWKAPFPTEGLFLRNYTPTVVACEDVVMCLTWDRLHAFSIADGKRLWAHKGAIGFASAGDLFAIDGLAWTIPITASIWKDNRLDKNGKITTGIPIPKEHFIGNGGKEIWGVDIHTGEVKRTFPRMEVLPGGHHHRCYRNKATVRYLICGRRGLEYVDLAGDNHVNNWWVRGLCQYGVMPANGFIYVPPDPCQCFNLIKLNGLHALAARSSLDEMKPAKEQVVERGPAYAAAEERRSRGKAGGTASPPAPPPAADLAWQPPIYPPQSDEWPTYRGNITRSGSTKSRVPARLKVLWRSRVGELLSAPVVADRKLLVCSKDAHTVHCLDAEGGKGLWQFAAGGRVDSPPTIHDGLCVFGCGDGSIYCLRLSDGELAWRFRAALVDRRVVADSRLESVWPIHGSVLVQDGVVYFAAGRSSYLDGGIRLFGLDLHSGRKLHEASISAVPVYRGKQGEPERSVGALPDVLVSDGHAINMRHVQFDAALQQRDSAELKTLCATTGLLEDAWAHRQNWCLGHPGKVNSLARPGGLSTQRGAGRSPVGKLIAFDGDAAYSVMNPYTWLKRTRDLWPEGHDGHLHQKYARYKAGDFLVGVRIAASGNGASPGLTPGKRRGKGRQQAPKPVAETWSIDEPFQPRAMVLAGDVLFMAGWLDAVAIQEKTGRPLDDDNPDPRRVFLRALSTADGKKLAEYKLDCEPAFDGMCCAYGRLYVALKDGSVLCMGPTD
ncbi:MAG: PQQ-binding-like beta-propeller repeat protein, partial [Phycisphaerae bacterium]